MSALALLASSTAPAGAADDLAGGNAPADCVLAAASVHRLPPLILVILLEVEGGTLGQVSRPNANGTVDIGPMQINQSWVPKVARHWGTSEAAAFAALRDRLCPNVEGGAWILRQAIDEADGDLWEGVGRYHSHDPARKGQYLRQVLRQALRLESSVEPTTRPNRKGTE